MVNTIPRINWPLEGGSYKFVQVEFDDSPYLRFDWRTHPEILRAFLDEVGIVDYPKEKANQGEIPSRQVNRYKLCGAGTAAVSYTDRKKVTMMGASGNYMTGPDKTHAEALQLIEQDWDCKILPEPERLRR